MQINGALREKGYYFVLSRYAEHFRTGGKVAKYDFDTKTNYHAWLSWLQCALRVDAIMSVQFPRQVKGREAKAMNQLLKRVQDRTCYLAYCLWHSLNRLRRVKEREPVIPTNDTIAATWM